MRFLVSTAFVVAAACGPKISRSDRTTAAELVPATFEVGKARTGDVRPLPIRVWVDPEVREVEGWKDRITDEIDYANQLLGPLIGVRLEVTATNDWDRTGELTGAVSQLAAVDPGDAKALWVIGYIGAGEASNALSDLGAAEPLGHHVVVRDYATEGERERLLQMMTGVSKAEREEVFDAHRRHKQAVVLLHHLARSMGTIAETDPAWIRHGGYSPKQSTLSDRNRELMQIAADARLDNKSKADLASALLGSIEAAEWGGWVAGDHASVTGALRNVIDAAKLGETAADVPAAAYSQFERARRLAQSGKTAEAIAELEPLLAAYPANGTMRLVVCELELRRGGPGSPAAKKACERAIEVAQGDPRPHIAIAMALMSARDIAAARAQLALAEGKVANLPDAKAGWIEIATVYQTLGMITYAEAAITKSGVADHPVHTWVKVTRARYGVPPNSKHVPPEEEGLYVAAVRTILDAIYADKYADAEKSAKAAEAKWKKAPGLLGARCDLALRREQVGAAKKLCAQAIAAYADASWAQYLMGIIVLRGPDTKAGIAHLRKSIAADPELSQAWRALAKALVRAKDKAALDQLAVEYQAKFGSPLPN
jgi:tetratricopeptide (TPR) repeat protein